MVLCCAEAAPRGRKNRARFPQNHAKWGKNTRSRRQIVSGTSIFRPIFHFGQGTAAFFCTRMGKYGAWRLLWPHFQATGSSETRSLQRLQLCLPQRPLGVAGHSPRRPGLVSFPWPHRATVIHAAGPPLPTAASRACSGPIFRRLTPLKRVAYSVSSSVCHSVHWASLGIRQSPRGDRATVPTLGPSGRQLRLNCCEKKRR